MGSSDWSYFVPYQDDIQAALDKIRHQVFQDGNYYLAPAYWKEIDDEEEYAEKMARDHPEENMYDEIKEGTRNELKTLRAIGDKPSTIEELFIWNAEDGTHSILDVSRVTDDPLGHTLKAAGPSFPETNYRLVRNFRNRCPTSGAAPYRTVRYVKTYAQDGRRERIRPARYALERLGDLRHHICR